MKWCRTCKNCDLLCCCRAGQRRHHRWSGLMYGRHRTTIAFPSNARVGQRLRDGGAVMYQFRCGHQECSSQYSASNKQALMQQVEDHLKEMHNVDKATETLMSYLEQTCVTSR